MPKARTTTLALTEHRLIYLGYTRVVGVEYSSGNTKWDMGGVIERPRFRSDGAPKFGVPAGIWDLEMESAMGVRLAVQCSSRDGIGKRVTKAKAREDYWSYEGFLEFWGWETIPQADGGYRLRVIDPKLEMDTIKIFYPETAQGELLETG